MAATLPLPAAASDLNCFIALKLLLNELVEMLDGPLVRTEACAPPAIEPTSVADKRRESPPSMPALLKRTFSPFVRPTRWASFCPCLLHPVFYPRVTGSVSILLQIRDAVGKISTKVCEPAGRRMRVVMSAGLSQLPGRRARSPSPAGPE